MAVKPEIPFTDDPVDVLEGIDDEAKEKLITFRQQFRPVEPKQVPVV